MSSGQIAYIFMLMFALFLIIIGFQGNLGVTIGILFTPQDVAIGQESTTTPNF